MKHIQNDTIITFIRHGQVENSGGILYGRLPGFELSETGKIEVSKTASLLKGSGISHLYTSPMKRARQTAGIIGSTLGLKPKVSYLLNEVKLIFQGISISKYHTFIQKDLYSVGNIKKGQESVGDIGSRMQKFVNLVTDRHLGGHVAAVSHGDPILILKAVTSGTDFTWEYKHVNYLSTGKYFTVKLKDGSYEWS